MDQDQDTGGDSSDADRMELERWKLGLLRKRLIVIAPSSCRNHLGEL